MMLSSHSASIRTAEQVTTELADALNGRVEPTAQARLDGFRAGRVEGFEHGLAQGRRHAEDTFRSAMAALNSALSAVEAQRGADEARLESLAIELAVELAEAIVGGDLSLITSGDAVIARAFRLRRAGESVRIRLSAEDAEILRETSHPDVEIVSDPTLRPGQAFADIGDGVTDLSIDAAIARVRGELA